jgi:hypothetical protein
MAAYGGYLRTPAYKEQIEAAIGRLVRTDDFQ